MGSSECSILVVISSSTEFTQVQSLISASFEEDKCPKMFYKKVIIIIIIIVTVVVVADIVWQVESLKVKHQHFHIPSNVSPCHPEYGCCCYMDLTV